MKEEYSGIKFQTILKDALPPSSEKLDELRHWCKVFHEKNLAPPYAGGSYGNLSFRIKPGENEFIITGTCIGLKDKLADDCFVKVTGCDLSNAFVYAEGKRYPSSESMLHYAIYKQRPDVNAVFHGHCKELIDNAKSLGIAETSIVAPYGSIELVNSVVNILGENNFFIIKEHGFVSLASSMIEAGENSVRIIEKIIK